MYLNEQIPMVCLGCLENKYFSLDLIFPVGWFSTKPSGSSSSRKDGFVRGAQEWYTGIALSTVKIHTQPMAQWVNASIHIIGCIILYIYLMGSILLLCTTGTYFYIFNFFRFPDGDEMVFTVDL
jgi:hypothetical protein